MLLRLKFHLLLFYQLNLPCHLLLIDQLIEFEEFMDDSTRHDQYIIHEFDEADPGDDIGDSRAAFSEANGSGFFQEGWYLNPFGSNFIGTGSNYDYKFIGNNGVEKN